MAEIVLAFIGPVVDCLVAPVKKHLGYLFSSTQHVTNLDAEIKQLERTFNGVKERKDTNERNTQETPHGVGDWLEEVEKIKTDAKTIPSNGNGGCFNIKARYQVGRKAWKTTPNIKRLHEQGLAFIWTDAQKPLGRVYTPRASTSTPSSSGGDSIGEAFKSRATTFDDALKLLQQDQKTTQVIALCGMGGVGKTTMMLQLKKVAEEKKMVDWIVKVDIGRQPNWHSLQQAVAENLGKPFKEEAETTWADRLRTRFEETLKKSEKGILVILDDVWKKVELGNLGLSPLPNGVKLLLTSRNEVFCNIIAVHEGNLKLKVLQVGVLEHEEAHKFLCKITNISKESDPDLYKIGGEIVKKCSCLPLAIKIIAPTLISEDKFVWEGTLRCLRSNDPDLNVQESIRISYDYLKDEDKKIFLLCGLFPEDSSIPIENLIRYAWGLKLQMRVPTFRDGRYRIIRCVSNLKKANLLIDGGNDCVKMHDLVLAFVLATVRTGDHDSFINHGDLSKWNGEDMSESCKRLSLTCKGMYEFPEGFKCPNISLLKLMHGDDSFKFPEGFYENTEKLQVITFEKMQYPFLPRSPQLCSTNLRTLCLHDCSLMFDISFIGDLSNLEVLSLAECKIRKLPSAIGKLKKLKVLDLTGCFDLLIDDCVLKRLVNLEELYMIPYKCIWSANAIRLTDANVDELEGCSKNLISLAIEFNALPENISFEKLERFKISLGCTFDPVYGESRYKFENSLKLVINKCEILDSMNKLFDKVEVLHLELNGVNNHGDALAKSLHHHASSFYNLRVLSICNCKKLKHLFTIPTANALTKLERLTISSCYDLETVVDGDKGGDGVVIFQALKFLSLGYLSNLKSLYNVVDVIELPQLLELELYSLPKLTSIYPSTTSSMSSNISGGKSFLNEKVVIPNLKKLDIGGLENLREIWPCQFGSSREVDDRMLRELKVWGCNSLVNLFSSNLMSLPYHLEELYIGGCDSIEVLFNFDLECAGNIEEARCCLRSIHVSGAKNLTEVWRIKGANHDSLAFSGFQAIESIEIEDCERFRNVFTPTTTNFDMRALANLKINSRQAPWKSILLAPKTNVMSNKEISKDNCNVVFSSNLIHTSRYVHASLQMEDREGGTMEFNIESPSGRELATTQNNQQPLLLLLKDLNLEDMECKSHVWKCNWNKFLIPPHKPERSSSSSFQKLTTISLERCNNIKYLFSPLMVKALSSLKEIIIFECGDFEEVVSNRDDEDEELVASTSINTSTHLFPHLDKLKLMHLSNLKRIGGGSSTKDRSKEITSTTSNSNHARSKLPQVHDGAWSLCQYAREIYISDCQALSYVIPLDAHGEMKKLEKLTIFSCQSLVEVFETQGFNINGCDTPIIDEGSGGNDATMVIRRMKNINVPQLSNLKELLIYGCDLLHHVLTFSTLESLTQLENLEISKCKAMQVIVKVDNGDQTMISSKVVVFQHLKSFQLLDLPNLTGFFLGKNVEFQWPSLDDVMIDGCPKMMRFTSGCSRTPKLNCIRTKLGKHSLECGLNFQTTTSHESPSSSLDTSNSCAIISDKTPWSFHNMIEMVLNCYLDVENIVPSNMLVRLQKLEKLNITCSAVEKVFEVLEGTNSNELQYVAVEIPNLREVELRYLQDLKYIWKNNPWMVLEFPNLTKLSIERCRSMEHVFTSSMIGSLLQLQELDISKCRRMEVVVKEAKVVVEEKGEGEGEGDDDKVDEIIMLPQLKSLKLKHLPSLKGFYLGKEAFSCPSLDTLEIISCPTMSVFTKGDLATPELRLIDTSLGRFELVREEDLNSFITTKTSTWVFHTTR